MNTYGRLRCFAALGALALPWGTPAMADENQSCVREVQQIGHGRRVMDNEGDPLMHIQGVKQGVEVAAVFDEPV